MIKKVFVFGLITASMMNVIAQETSVLKMNTQGKDYGITETFVYENKRLVYHEEFDDNDLTITILDNDFELVKTITIPDIRDDSNYNLFDDSVYQTVVHIDHEYDARGALQRNVPFTQTLFNDDENLEFLIATCQKEAKDTYRGKVIKFEIVSEDGTILGTFLPDGEYTNFTTATHSLGTTNYLAIVANGSSSNSYWNFYKISNEAPNSVSISSVSPSFAFPNPVAANEPLTIQLDASTTLASGSYVEIINMAGATITRQPIEANDNQVFVSTQRLSQGQYIYNMVSGGEIIDSGKIVVR